MNDIKDNSNEKWVEVIQECIADKWTPESKKEVPDVDKLMTRCTACHHSTRLCTSRENPYVDCTNCPIAEYTGKSHCDGTPYESLSEIWTEGLCEDEDNLTGGNLEEIHDIIRQEISFLNKVKNYILNDRKV